MTVTTTTITKSQLITMAGSSNPATCKRAFEIYQAWVAAAPKLQARDQLNATDRVVLLRIFASKNIR